MTKGTRPADPGAGSEEMARRDWRGGERPRPGCIAACPTSARLASARPERTAIAVQPPRGARTAATTSAAARARCGDPGPTESGVRQHGRDRAGVDRRAPVVRHRRRLERKPEAGRSQARSGSPRPRTAGSSPTAHAAGRRTRRAADRRSSRRSSIAARKWTKRQSARAVTSERAPPERRRVRPLTSSCPSCRPCRRAAGPPAPTPWTGNSTATEPPCSKFSVAVTFVALGRAAWSGG